MILLIPQTSSCHFLCSTHLHHSTLATRLSYTPQNTLSSVQPLSHVWLFVTPWAAARQASCPSPTARVYLNSCLLSRWCHPTISSSVVPFSSCLQSFPASGSFPMSQFFTSGGQSIGVSASTSVLLMNIQYWFPLGWRGPWLIQFLPLRMSFDITRPQFFPCNLKDQVTSGLLPSLTFSCFLFWNFSIEEQV